MIFELTEEQVKKYKEWNTTLPKVDFGAIGGGTSFIFTPTGIGTIVWAKRDDGYEIDLTEWEYF